ncbi:MAG TPA: YceI family protein [Bacteroidia bacterium]|nr:YceI family protein [Bacteroidia bacterium]HNT79330.1 YceI family protein [Bacteroidia bacterium]
MKKLNLLLLALIFPLTMFAQVYMSSDGKISFFSKAPLENIEAETHSATSVLNTSNNEVVFKIPITTFKFEKPLMQEHFNEKYMESDKFPFASFKGVIGEGFDMRKEGPQQVKGSGELEIHGVKKERVENATIEVQNGNIVLKGSFDVMLKDHDIKIPKLLTENIAEKVNVKFEFTYKPYKPKDKKE